MKLFIPGPTDVRQEVLEAMARPPISHRGEEISALGLRLEERARKLMGTSNRILFSTSSATGLMEAAVRNTVERRLLSVVCGAFSKRWFDIAGACSVPADALEVPWGRAVDPEAVDEKLSSGKYDALTVVHNETSTGVANPIAAIGEVVKRHPDVVFLVDTVSSLAGMPVDVDGYGIDLCLAGVQKCLALPPGFALCSVSGRVLERSSRARDKGWYFDLARMAAKAEKGQSPTTPSIPHMYGLDVQLGLILEEGLERRWARHRQMAEMTRSWARDRFALYAEESACSDTVTCIANNRGADVGAMIAGMKKRGYLLSNGYGDLKGKAFRIAHMGERQVSEMEEMLADLDEVLG